ncbi:hypothetical protein D7243_22985 [Stutzerimonas stutzeri]|nr:hypothetical protein [Stutzerimonas stutzeri]
MHTDKAIAEFEAWWIKQPHRDQFEDVKEQMRNVWVASRTDSVDLDGLVSVHHQLGMVCLSFKNPEQTRSFAKSCRAVIAAGVTVKE